MSISWHSIGHVFASGLHDIVVASRAIASFNNKIQPEASTIETITSFVPVYGPEAATIERLAFAALGEFSALVQASGGAQQAAQKVPAADPALLQEIETLLKNNPALVKQAAQLFGIKSA